MSKPKVQDPGPKDAREPDPDAARRAIENAAQHKDGTAVKVTRGRAPAREE